MRMRIFELVLKTPPSPGHKNVNTKHLDIDHEESILHI